MLTPWKLSGSHLLKLLAAFVVVAAVAAGGAAGTGAARQPLTQIAAPQGCRGGDPMANVYQPSRLKILVRCVEMTGIVKVIYHEPDGDYHVNVIPDPAFRYLLNEGNYMDQAGALVTEIVPADQKVVPVPAVGAHVRVVGPWVTDLNHGHNEIHPVWVMQTLTPQGTAVAANTPAAGPTSTPVPGATNTPVASPTNTPVVLPSSLVSKVTAINCGIAPSNVKSGPLIHSVTICPAPAVTDYLEGTIVAYTWPGAACTTKVRYNNGFYAQSLHLQFRRIAGSSGRVLWWWVPDTKATGKTLATVTCALGSRHQYVNVSFTLNPGTVPED